MRILRLFVIAVAVVILTWLSVGLGMANLARAASPETALSLYPFDARARSNVAEKAVPEAMRNPSQAGEIERLALAVLQRDPTVVGAWRVMGITAALRGDEVRARQIIRYAERVSRRDLPVQLWLIEDRVRQDDVAGALRHYDIALRTSATSRQLLFPILTAASAEPHVARPLIELLRANPAWRREFAYHVTHSTASADTLPLLVEHLAGTEVERGIMFPMVQRLVTAREYRTAWRVYRALKRARGSLPEPVRDGTFSSVPEIAPFDWVLAGEGSVRAERRFRPSSAEDSALFVSAEAGTAAEAARQLLLLEPGSYDLSVEIGSVPEVRPAGVDMGLACLGEPARVLAREVRIPARQAGARHNLRITVPADCPAQMLTFGVRSETDIGVSEAWIDSVAISRPR